MDSSHDIEELERASYAGPTEEPESVDDFIRQLEAREKDLHITSETTIIEISESFDDGNPSNFLAAEVPAAKTPASPERKVAADDERTKALENEAKELKAAVKLLENEKAELYDTAQRRQKDLDNFRSRVERERGDTFQNQLGNLATQMLPALDNLNRAVDFALSLPRDQTAEFSQFIDGIVLVNQQMNEVLAAMGVRPIATVGEIFDPHFHEAVAAEESEEFPVGTVFEEVLHGYRIGNRVIRPSMVKVVRSRDKGSAAESAATDLVGEEPVNGTDDVVERIE